MKRVSTTETALPPIKAGAVGKAWDDVSASFERFCLTSGIEALSAMMEKEAEELCGPRHARGEGRRGYRWGHTQGRLASMAARSISNGRGFVSSAARSWCCRAGSTPWQRTGSGGGR